MIVYGKDLITFRLAIMRELNNLRKIIKKITNNNNRKNCTSNLNIGMQTCFQELLILNSNIIKYTWDY